MGSSVLVNSFFAHPIGQSPFLHTFSVTGGEKIHATPPPRPRKETVYFLLRTGETTRAVGIFLALAFACPRSAAVLPDRTQKSATGEESTRTRSFSRPCWRTLFLLLLW